MSNDQEGNIADIDFSVIRTAIEIGGKPIEQVLNGVHYGSPEVRCLLLDECELIIECKVCRALFRALPLFVAHKRVYCTKSFQESQPPLFETIVTDETVVVQPTAPEDDDSSTRAPAQEAANPEAQLNQLVEQIQAGKAGHSEEYKFYSNVAGLVEKRKELGKPTMNLELKTIPTNRNAVMVNLTEAVSASETQNEVHDNAPTAAEVKGSSKLETLLTQKILPKCKNQSVIKNKCDVSDKSNASSKTLTPNSEAAVVTATKTKECVAAVASDTKSKEKAAGTSVLEKPSESEVIKSAAKNPATASRVSAREKKPSLKTRVTELPESDETLDLTSLKCLKCHMSYSSKKTLLYHFQMRHSQLRTFFPCPYCSNIFFYFWGLTRHMMKIHKKSKNQIDKMRDKLRKRAFTKCITKSCNIAKDQLQFIADEEDDSHLGDKDVNEVMSTSKSVKQQTPASQPSKNSSTAKPKASSAEKNVKVSYVNDYETPKIHREPRISLKEGLRNSKDKQNDSRKAVVKRMSDSPRTRNPSWAEVSTKGRGTRKSDSPKSTSDEDPSPKSKERALDELQKKLTEAASGPIVTRSSSNERLHSDSRSSAECKNDSTALVWGNEVKTERPESRRKPGEPAVSSAVTERRPVVSGGLQGLEKPRLISECSPGKNKLQDGSQVGHSAKNDEIILGSRQTEPAKLTVDRPGARRRQIQIGTTVGPRMLSEKLVSAENKDVTGKQKENADKLRSPQTGEAGVSEQQGERCEGRSGTQKKTVEEKFESGQELSDREADESRGRLSRRRTPTAKAQASASDTRGKNEVTERKSDKNDKQSDKLQSKVVSKNEKSEKDGGQEKHVENVNKKSTWNVLNSSSIEDNKNRPVKSDIQKTTSTQSKTALKDKIQKNSNTSETGPRILQGKDGRLPNSSTVVVENSSCAENSNKSDNVEPELPEKVSSSRSSSAERMLRSRETPEVKVIPKESKPADVKHAGETTMRLYASPPGSKPLIKHSRIKKMNEFVVRCVPQGMSSPVASPEVKAPADLHLGGESSGVQSDEQNSIPGKSDITDIKTKEGKTAIESSSDMDKDVTVTTSNVRSGLGNSEGNTHESSSALGKDGDGECESAADDDDCSVVSSEDNTASSTGTPTPRIRSFRCGCGRRFSCKVGFTNHRRACTVEDSDLFQVPIKIDRKKVTTEVSDKSDSCSAGEEKKNLFVCQCGKQFSVKVGLSNHQRACLKEDTKNLSDTDAKKVQNFNINSAESKDCSAKSIFSMQSSFELFSCDKCNRVFGRKVSFINHQQNCTEKKPEETRTSKPSKDLNLSGDRKDTPNKTSSTRRKFPARKLSTFCSDATDSDDEHSTQKQSSSLQSVSGERQSELPVRPAAPHRKRTYSDRSEQQGELDCPPEKQMRVIEEIWVDKAPGRPVEKVRSNRIYVMEAQGSGRLHCQDTKKLCDIADEASMRCLVCLQEFTSVSNLRRHAIRHLGWKRYKCKMCRFSSYNKSECNTHIIRTHAEKVRSAAATEYMIVDLNKEASRVRTEKKKQTLSERKASEMEISGQGRYQSHSRQRHEKSSPRVPEDRRKPAVREENIHNPVTQNTFNISTRNSPRKFDTRPYQTVDQLSTLCTRKSYYVKPDQWAAVSSGKKRSFSSTPASESGEETVDSSSAKQKRGSSGTSQGKADEQKESSEVDRVNSGGENQDEAASGADRMDDYGSMSDTESLTRSVHPAGRQHRTSSEARDTGYASDSCLAHHSSPSSAHAKTKSVSSESAVHKHRKLSGGSTSSSSEKGSTPTGSGSGSRPLTMMSIQDMFELIKPKPRPERKSVGDTPAKAAGKPSTNRSDGPVRRVSLEGAVVTRKQADAVSSLEGAVVTRKQADAVSSLEGAVVTRKQADAVSSLEGAVVTRKQADAVSSLEGAVVTRKQADVSQAGDREKTGSMKELSSKGDNPVSGDVTGKAGLTDAARKTGSTVTRNVNKDA